MAKSSGPSFGVLIVDDEEAYLRSLSMTLERSCGISNIHRCQDSRQVTDLMSQNHIGMVLLDLNMPHLSGQDVLAKIIEYFPKTIVIVISGMNDIGTAVSCVKAGAYDYFVKTTEQTRLVDGIRRAIQLRELQDENDALRSRFLSDKLEQPEAFDAILTSNKNLRAVFQYVESVSRSNQSLLITGESGVGKELLARASHRVAKVSGPLVTMNIAGLDDDVFSDTMFGHKRGAFTGADQARAGMVEKATGGTLFLDEIGDLSMASQVKLLRLLQEGEYYPLGSDKPKKLRARIIACTHRDLEQKLRDQEFRKDLYYRLTTHQVAIPPLRDRKEDLPMLLNHFVDEAAKEYGIEAPQIPARLSSMLAGYAFPGNVRELRAIVYDAVSTHQSGTLSLTPFEHAIAQASPGIEALPDARSLFPDNVPLPSLRTMNDLLVEEAMRRSAKNQTAAARMLGISQPALSKRLKNMTS